jgi:hypothetical protein
MNLSGYWQGTIIYGPDYGPEIEGKELFFEMTLNELDGDFTGIARDTGGFGNLIDDATVSGFWDGETISFIKKYKYFTSFDEKGKMVIDETKEPDEINYTGTFNSEKDLFEGEWEIILNTEELLEGWGEEFCSGAWNMRKR